MDFISNFHIQKKKSGFMYHHNGLREADDIPYGCTGATMFPAKG